MTARTSPAGLARLLPLLAAFVGGSASAGEMIERPELAAEVAARKLPPVQDRIPKVPRVIDLEKMGRESGKHGGEIRMLAGGQSDLRIIVIYSYVRLVGYDEHLNLIPDLLERFEVAGERAFTLHLRPGHRWSDGSPFTAED